VYTLADEWQYGASAEETPFLNFPLNNNGEALRPLRFLWKYVAYQEAANIGAVHPVSMDRVWAP